ncbi:MBL fold metallo-hydrolase [Nocardia sp. NBC_00565]|uniref:MBL fold metallo-hydrolase n=1 Tax=Nocardia sp. NBC_00565 TaxID=2975993 RepID=UPI002E80FE37|nr:MBL fold metallo-hydrolase [Nocardia sp. NBC_00565]WUC03048.1 MBL fold metallo-hydrolase [Nocardia sp. NBC_00565]
MRVHHLNCGTMRPPGGRLMDGTGGFLHRGEMICHCLLIELDSGLVLVETGVGEQAVRRPVEWLGRRFIRLTSPVLDLAQTAAHQVEALGYRREDVRDILLTHLDLDHAGGLADFPHARVHVYAEELRALEGAHSAEERLRYKEPQFRHGPRWESYADTGESWFGFDAVRELSGLPPTILLIPLAGHTRGHAGIAVDTGNGWLLSAGDAYFHPGVLDPVRPHQPLGLSLFEKSVQTLRGPRLDNQQRLRELIRDHGDEVTVFSAHNAAELRALQRVAA